MKNKLFDIKFREVGLIDKEIKRLWNIVDEKTDSIDFNEINSFSEFENIAIDEKRKISELNRRRRMIMPYELEDIPDYGDIYTIEEFISNCKSGGFIDYDGFGKYAIDNKMSNITIYPSDIKNNSIREGFNNVIWFNK